MARPETEAKIFQALEDTILEQGMKGLGINAVGKRAGVSTELIYRYFDGLPGLLLTWMQQQDFWTQHGPERAATDYKHENASDMIEAMLHGQVAALRTNPVLAEIRRWELIEPTESGRALAERRGSACARCRLASAYWTDVGRCAVSVASRQDRRRFSGHSDCQGRRLGSDLASGSSATRGLTG